MKRHCNRGSRDRPVGCHNRHSWTLAKFAKACAQQLLALVVERSGGLVKKPEQYTPGGRASPQANTQSRDRNPPFLSGREQPEGQIALRPDTAFVHGFFDRFAGWRGPLLVRVQGALPPKILAHAERIVPSRCMTLKNKP